MNDHELAPTLPPSVPHAGPRASSALLPPATAKVLAEVGFLAIDRQDWVRARTIFSVLQAFRAERAFPYVGLALIELMQSRPEAAAAVARTGMATVSDPDVLKELLELAELAKGGA